MKGVTGGRTGFSLLLLLGPFFGLWALFWLVPLGMGVDLSLQSPDFRPVHRDAVLPEDAPSSSSLTFLDWRKEKEEVIEDVPRYVGLDNFSKAIADSKFHKALKNTLVYVAGFDSRNLARSLHACRQSPRSGEDPEGDSGLFSDDSGLGLAGSPVDSFLFVLSWADGGVEPVSRDPAWFRSG